MCRHGDAGKRGLGYDEAVVELGGVQGLDADAGEGAVEEESVVYGGRAAEAAMVRSYLARIARTRAAVTGGRLVRRTWQG